MPAGVASGDIAQNYLLEPLSQAAATQLYRKDTSGQKIHSAHIEAKRVDCAAARRGNLGL